MVMAVGAGRLFNWVFILKVKIISLLFIKSSIKIQCIEFSFEGKNYFFTFYKKFNKNWMHWFLISRKNYFFTFYKKFNNNSLHWFFISRKNYFFTFYKKFNKNSMHWFFFLKINDK
jgi:hypothetical protein